MRIKSTVLAGLVLLTLTGCVMPPTVTASTASSAPAAPASTQAEPAAATPTPEPEPAAEVGSRENPFPAGTPLVSDEWEGVVGPTNLDASAAVAEGNMFNDPAPEGLVYIGIPITATYTGADEANSMQISLEYVTASGEVIDSTTHSSFVSADDTNPMQDLFTGGTVSFTEYLLVPAEGVDQGLIRATFGWINGAEGFVTLQ